MNDNPFKMPTISISLEGFSAGLFSSQRVFFHQTGDNIVLAITKISEAAFEALNEWATAEQLQTEKDVIDRKPRLFQLYKRMNELTVIELKGDAVSLVNDLQKILSYQRYLAEEMICEIEEIVDVAAIQKAVKRSADVEASLPAAMVQLKPLLPKWLQLTRRNRR